MAGGRLISEEKLQQLRDILFFEADPNTPQQKNRLEAGGLVFCGPDESLANRLFDYKKTLLEGLALIRLLRVRSFLDGGSLGQTPEGLRLRDYVEGRIDDRTDKLAHDPDKMVGGIVTFWNPTE